MNWIFAILPVLVLVLVTLAVLRRRAEIREYQRRHLERVEARHVGSDKARLQYPDIDLSLCIGCGACVRACPEEGVIDLLHGQAVVVHGARCVGHGQCAEACPTGAIALTLGDLSGRKDLPAIDGNLEAVRNPGLFLAGELSGFALVRTAVKHGTSVADRVARELAERNGAAGDGDGVVDLLIVGSGPAGLACALRCKELGVSSLVLEQSEAIGGTVASYPRKKMVMTQPVDLPLHGRLPRLTYQKEELVELWERLVREHELPVRLGTRMTGFERGADGRYTVQTTGGEVRAQNLCLALGRRGTPRKLGVPGEELPKVAYSLIDAESYQGRELLVVGGGDSAVEAALALAMQPGNTVTLSYRKAAFFRIKARNSHRLDRAVKEGRLRVLFESEVTAIEPDSVGVRLQDGEVVAIRNDGVFVFAGGIPPFELLERGGVSFDPNDRPDTTPQIVTGTPISQIALLVFAVGMLVLAVLFSDYYSAPSTTRSLSSSHPLLRPSGPLGLSFAVAACALFVCNLAYLWRRAPRLGRWLPGTLRKWMTSHIFTGVVAFMLVLLHSGFSVRNTVGGHAFVALAIVIGAGVLGRYLYSFIPRAANGRAVDLDEASRSLKGLSLEWDTRDGRGFGAVVHEEIERLIDANRWDPSFFARLRNLFTGQVRVWRMLRRIRVAGKRGDVTAADVRRITVLARRTYRLSLGVTHYEELRAVLASWRYFHRWLALLMILLAVVHIVVASRYADLAWPFGIGRGGAS